jgi:hypothetical protein
MEAKTHHVFRSGWVWFFVLCFYVPPAAAALVPLSSDPGRVTDLSLASGLSKTDFDAISLQAPAESDRTGSAADLLTSGMQYLSMNSASSAHLSLPMAGNARDDSDASQTNARGATLMLALGVIGLVLIRACNNRSRNLMSD